MKDFSLKVRAYITMFKMRLSLLVCFSAAFGYLLSGAAWNSSQFVWLSAIVLKRREIVLQKMVLHVLGLLTADYAATAVRAAAAVSLK